MSNPFSREEKKFSIGVPFYGDHYDDFKKFFEVMNGSDYKNFEIVVTFDGENKKGVKALEKEIKKYDMDIKYQTIEHGGCTVARNACRDLFTGDYYCFMGSDYYIYPEALRLWHNSFEEHPEINRIWGLYDIVTETGETQFTVGQIPHYGGKVWYESVKYSPAIDAGMPIRAEYFSPWTPGCISLNDWDWSLTHLEKTNYKGDDHLYIPQSFYAAEAPRPGGLSNDSASNWIERKKFVQDRHGITPSDICVTSLGAMNHAIPTAKMLGADVLTMPSFKPHNYKTVYLLGFYTREDPNNPGFVTRTHMDVFQGNKGKNIIHWIGTDIADLYWSNSFMKLKAIREWMAENKVINLCECKTTQKELKDIGIEAKIVPIPPEKLYEPMPLPKEFSVGIYLPKGDPEKYKEQLMYEVIRSMPDIKFYLFGNDETKGQKGENWEALGYIDFDEWMPKFSANLRITMHDGLPLTPLQFMTAGRNVVSNVKLKGGIYVHESILSGGKDAWKVSNMREGIVKAIRKAQKEPLSKEISDYWNKELDVKKFVKRIRGLK
jgi:glycosyltransferase involved in cell wall biosynthesis